MANQPGKGNLELGLQIKQRLVDKGLPPSVAKLYSQYTKRRSGQPGLRSWGDDEPSILLEDATILLEVAIEMKSGDETGWQKTMVRSGEIIEWLSHPSMGMGEVPLRLISAAIYQIAGYPARSSGLLNVATQYQNESEILRCLLEADFPALLKALVSYWVGRLPSNREKVSSPIGEQPVDFQSELRNWVVEETVRAVGILCSSMRWRNEPRMEKALVNLGKVAQVMWHGEHFYSALLAQLCHGVASEYLNVSMRNCLSPVRESLVGSGQDVLERYLRQSYLKRKALAWPSQILGFEYLSRGESFALCTPTGSGKTTIAEVAIIQSLFTESQITSETPVNGVGAPLALYLVPTRALAAEVESKFSRILRRTEVPVIVVTGLYGGTDWGPTDTWLTADERTVLICTYEKAEALIRFLGPLFMPRVSLVVVDEAHKVQFDGNRESLRRSESRSLRLESLVTRLLSYLDESRVRTIALSAVAERLERPLTQWVTEGQKSLPAKIEYRSTRQLIGRLMCLPNREFEIRYDLLDGTDLEFQTEGQSDRPYVPRPFPPFPQTSVRFKGAEKSLRPYLFWAAMHSSVLEQDGNRRAVLISIPQQIEGYAKDFLTLLEGDWQSDDLPEFFEPPTDGRKQALWHQCLDACQDYFGEDSYEYRLLQKGVVVHHGKMPGLMARLLVEIIDERIVHLVLATSTLSEGINLPFEVVLIPTLRRGRSDFNIQEFANLVGRAGRPGVSTEGQSLVLLDAQPLPGDNSLARSIRRARKRYFRLIEDLKRQRESSRARGEARSPLAELIRSIETLWHQHFGDGQTEKFLEWLEKASPLDPGSNPIEIVEALDSLDAILLSVIVEAELLAGEEVDSTELENRLKSIWSRSFAYYASKEQERLESLFIERGKGLRVNVYKDLVVRRRLYRTSLPPRDGDSLLRLYPTIKQDLARGKDYANWSREEQFYYVRDIVGLLGQLKRFGLGNPPRPSSWNEILRWWLVHERESFPEASKISKWYSYVSKNFQYRFNWGLGSVIALALDESSGGNLCGTSLTDWTGTGLPWIVFWMKELTIWGTLDPVAAYLLASGTRVTRNEAERIAQTFYTENQHLSADEKLDPSKIKEWGARVARRGRNRRDSSSPPVLPATLLRDFSVISGHIWRVMPVEAENEIYWFDFAGFPLAKSHKPSNWIPSYLDSYDFILNSSRKEVRSEIYV